jgi:hypothetical protein
MTITRTSAALIATLLIFCAPLYAENQNSNWCLKQKHQIIGNLELHVSSNKLQIHFLDNHTILIADSKSQKLYFFSSITKKLYSSKLNSFMLPVSRIYLMTAPDLQPDPRKWKLVGLTRVPNLGPASIYKNSFDITAGARNAEKGFIVGTGKNLKDATKLVLSNEVQCDPALIQLVCRLYSLPSLGKFPISAKINSESVERLSTIKASKEARPATDFELPKGFSICKTPEEVTGNYNQTDFDYMIGPKSEK